MCSTVPSKLACCRRLEFFTFNSGLWHLLLDEHFGRTYGHRTTISFHLSLTICAIVQRPSRIKRIRCISFRIAVSSQFGVDEVLPSFLLSSSASVNWLCSPSSSILVDSRTTKICDLYIKVCEKFSIHGDLPSCDLRVPTRLYKLTTVPLKICLNLDTITRL